MRAYRVLVQKVPTSSGYTINHTATVFLMDAEGRFVGSLSFPGTAGNPDHEVAPTGGWPVAGVWPARSPTLAGR